MSLLSDHSLMLPKFWEAETFPRYCGGRPYWNHVKQFIGVTGDPEVEKESARSLRAKRLRWPLTRDSLL